jgi:hypothetical protein
MYPNPQDALPLPPHPDLRNYRKRAKDLAGACRTGEDAIRSWASRWIEALLDTQSHDFRPARRDTERYTQQVAEFARDQFARAGCTLAQAQFVIARAHGFGSWTKFVRHVEGCTRTDSRVSAFETAADAIVSGDLPAVERMLAHNATLVRARSGREHQATLLHYVSANGVENYRQKSPPNIVAIARLLLDAGALVDAEADVYGGGATTLGLVVTSTPPRAAGVQIALADLLLERGARLDPGSVRGCLMNGCPEAAAHLAALGVPLSLEEAAGIGRIDIVASNFEQPGTVSMADASAALMMASWYDQRDVIRLLLDRGVDAGTRAPKDGDTALHIAAYRGNVGLVELLLRRGAPVNVTDSVYGTTPLVWAMHAWLVENRQDADAYRTVMRMLADAGALVKPEWLTDPRLRADADLYLTLSRRATAT